jgi:hypothetical protein
MAHRNNPSIMRILKVINTNIYTDYFCAFDSYLFSLRDNFFLYLLYFAHSNTLCVTSKCKSWNDI